MGKREIRKGKMSKENPTFSMKSSIQHCMGLVDGLCCASLRHVSDAVNDQEIQNRKKDDMRKFFTSYDLSHLDKNAGEGSIASNSILSEDTSRKATFPMIDKASKERSETTNLRPVSALLHTVVPTSFLPRGYGIVEDERDGSGERDQSPMLGGDENSCCHSFLPQMSNDHHYDLQEPHTLTPADTYTTVSLSQSYMWDEDDDDEDEILSPADSVFRRESGRNTSPSSSQRSSPSSFTSKTHEAYKYLLRMKPQNYIHRTSSEEEDQDYNSHCGLFLYYNDVKSTSPPAMPYLEESRK